MSKGLVFAGSMIIGLLVIIIFGSPFGEPPQQAYERGYLEGYLYGSYQVTKIFDGRNNYADGLLDAWEYGMRDCLGDSLVDEFFAGKVDPTDTMPAVEYTHPDSIDTSRVGKVTGGAW